ncbi:MAG: hypothetical protein LBE15_03775, partial [Burkholderiales bacterium]|nr:hypothetical protein [Burkholderiales bacterium]
SRQLERQSVDVLYEALERVSEVRNQESGIRTPSFCAERSEVAESMKTASRLCVRKVPGWRFAYPGYARLLANAAWILRLRAE